MERFPLRRLKLRPGDEHRESLSVGVEPFVLGGLEYPVVPALLDVELTVQQAIGSDIFRLRFRAGLTGPCMRCLGDAALSLVLDATEVHDGTPDAPLELRSDYIEAGDLLVGAWARDVVAASLPDRILCRPDCAGLCADCGLPLGEGAHDHGREPTDSRWAALAELRSDAEGGD